MWGKEWITIHGNDNLHIFQENFMRVKTQAGATAYLTHDGNIPVFFSLTINVQAEMLCG